MTVRWVPVPGWEGFYEVSDQGFVRSLDRVITTSAGHLRRLRGRELRFRPHKNGYPRVGFYREGASADFEVHRLVMLAFVGPCPAGLEVCHGDDNPSNNSLSNLRYDTRSSNAKDAVRNGRNLYALREKCPRGHLLVEPNLVVGELPVRHCRSCDIAHSRRTTARRRGRPLPDLLETSNTVYASFGLVPKDHESPDPEVLG